MIIALGLASRHYAAQLPSWNKEYVGDILYALMVFVIIKFITPNLPIRRTAVSAAVFCLVIETSQLYHAAWIDELRKTTLGGLVLGFGFSYSDLACYAVGILIGVLVENALNGAAGSKSFSKRR